MKRNAGDESPDDTPPPSIVERLLEHTTLLVIIGVLIGAGIVPAASAVLGPLSNTASVQGGVPLVAPNNLTVVVNESASVNLTDPFPSQNHVVVVSSSGRLSVSSTGPATVGVEEINGTWTKLSGMTVGSTMLRVDPGDKPAVNLSGNLSAFHYRNDLAVNDDQADLYYAGPSGGAVIVLRGLPGNETIRAVDVASGAVLAKNTTSPGGRLWLAVPTSSHTVELVTTLGDVAPMYNNTTPSVANESWMAGRKDPSLGNVSAFVVRVGPFVIGSGVPAQGGVGMASVMLLGLVVGGLLVSIGAGPRLGLSGGAVLFVAAVGGLATTGVLPGWLYAIALFAVGLVAATVLIRILQ